MLADITVDSWVLLDRTGLNWPEDLNTYNAFLPRRIGPFRILSTDDFGNSNLALPTGWRVHPTFAREKLFPYSRSDIPIPKMTIPPPEVEYTVSAILDIKG
jgi:hypothetical protein